MTDNAILSECVYRVRFSAESSCRLAVVAQVENAAAIVVGLRAKRDETCAHYSNAYNSENTRSMPSENLYRETQTTEPLETTSEKPKTSLVALGFGAWVSGFVVTNVAKGMIVDGMTPMIRGLLLGGSLVQLTGSAILLFCLIRFIIRKVTGKS